MVQSAGILVYRKRDDKIEVLLTHPGGPFWANKDVWSIPKGELDSDENHMAAAKREFKEELGVPPPAGELIDLGSNKSSHKTNYIWAVEGDLEPKDVHLNSIFTMEWPPKSGQMQEFPENDRAEWFELSTAKSKVYKSQTEFIDRLAEKLNVGLEATESAENSQQSLL